MTKNPFVNALGASAYIILAVMGMNFVTQPLKNKPDTFFAPVIFLSILTLSVAVMAFLFFYQPVQLFIEGKKKEAVNLFAKTLGIFAVITVIASILLFSGLI
jgi:predicted membrane channel-forming protein YqfA (hemolysin III family)